VRGDNNISFLGFGGCLEFGVKRSSCDLVVGSNDKL